MPITKDLPRTISFLDTELIYNRICSIEHSLHEYMDRDALNTRMKDLQMMHSILKSLQELINEFYRASHTKEGD